MLLRRRGCPARGDRNPWSAAVGVLVLPVPRRTYSAAAKQLRAGTANRGCEARRPESDGCEQESSGRCERSLAGQGHHSFCLLVSYGPLGRFYNSADPQLGLDVSWTYKLTHGCEVIHRSPSPSCAAQNRSRRRDSRDRQPPGFLPSGRRRRRRQTSAATMRCAVLSLFAARATALSSPNIRVAEVPKLADLSLIHI